MGCEGEEVQPHEHWCATFPINCFHFAIDMESMVLVVVKMMPGWRCVATMEVKYGAKSNHEE